MPQVMKLYITPGPPTQTFFKNDGSRRFQRHDLNDRNYEQSRAEYKVGIIKEGLYSLVGSQPIVMPSTTEESAANRTLYLISGATRIEATYDAVAEAPESEQVGIRICKDRNKQQQCTRTTSCSNNRKLGKTYFATLIIMSDNLANLYPSLPVLRRCIDLLTSRLHISCASVRVRACERACVTHIYVCVCHRCACVCVCICARISVITRTAGVCMRVFELACVCVSV